MSPLNRRARVLVLIKGLGIGGAETLIAESSSFWDREAFEYRVAYLLPWKDQLVPRLRDGGVPVDCLDWIRPSDPRGPWNLRRLAKSWQPDIIHAHLPAAGVLARLVASDTVHFYTEHNIANSYRQPTRWLNRVTYAKNDAVIAVSQAVAESISAYPGPDPQVIPNGVTVDVSIEEVARVRAELDIGPEDQLVVHVGNIRPHKGHSTLIDAARLLAEKASQAVVVSIGGEKHAGDLERIRTEAESKGANGRIRFLGRRSDARAFIAAADVVVNPADVEGLPVVILEALALERPVVATAVGGVPTVVKHEETGLLVPPRNAPRLAEAVSRALTSEDAHRWGMAGARLVRESHGLDQMVAAYESLYRATLNG